MFRALLKTVTVGTAAILLMSVAVATASASAGEALSAAALQSKVNNRPINEGRVGVMNFKMTNDRGKTRQRQALMLHAKQEGIVKIAIHFQTPFAIEGTAFLGIDHQQADDENWIYLPATERVRRLPASDLSDSFMGTDLSYGDVVDDFKLPEDKWTATLAGTRDMNGRELPVLTGQARSAAIAIDMGYSSFVAVIDTETYFPILLEYFDEEGAKLKTTVIAEQNKVGTAWTPMRFKTENHRTGHMTEIWFDDMRAVAMVGQDAFNPELLSYGAPDL